MLYILCDILSGEYEDLVPPMGMPAHMKLAYQEEADDPGSIVRYDTT